MPPHDVSICPYCQIGHLHAGLATYIHIYDGRIIAAPDTPVQICDVCARQEFDPSALARLYALTGEQPFESRVGDEPRANLPASSPAKEIKKPVDTQQADS